MFSFKKKRSNDDRESVRLQEERKSHEKRKRESKSHQSWKFVKIKNLSSDGNFSKSSSFKSFDSRSLREGKCSQDEKDVIRILKGPRPCQSVVPSMVGQERKTIRANSFQTKDEEPRELFRLKGGSSDNNLGQGRKGTVRGFYTSNGGTQQTFNLNATNEDGKLACTGNPPAKLGLCLELSYSPCESKKCAEAQTEDFDFVEPVTEDEEEEEEEVEIEEPQEEEKIPKACTPLCWTWDEFDAFGMCVSLQLKLLPLQEAVRLQTQILELLSSKLLKHSEFVKNVKGNACKHGQTPKVEQGSNAAGLEPKSRRQREERQ